MKNTYIINLYGLPCSGKSTAASFIFFSLKKLGFSVEYNLEVAKDLILNGDIKALEDHIYMLGVQHRLIGKLYGKVDFIITDAPLPLIEAYAKLNSDYNIEFHNLIKSVHNRYNNLEIELISNFKYDPLFRVDREEKTKIRIIKNIHQTFKEFNIIPLKLKPDFQIEEILRRLKI